MINQLKILTILPYKENYTKSKAQAAAIWVYDFLKFSRYKKDILVIGNTKGKNYLSKNYLNINTPRQTNERPHSLHQLLSFFLSLNTPTTTIF